MSEDMEATTLGEGNRFIPRCTCGFAEKVEAALNTILKRTGAGGICWSLDTDEGNILKPLIPSKEYNTKCGAACDLPAAIFELRDKVKPPKPKEREWRVGDIVILRLSDDVVRGLAREIRSLSGRRHDGFYIHGNSAEMGMQGWRNLTLEAEQAGEK